MALNPPTYEAVSCHGPRAQLSTGELLYLILDGRHIYSADNPLLPRYELSSSPREATSMAIAIKKARYRLSRNNGQGRLQLRFDDMYTYRDASFRLQSRRHVVINGKIRDDRIYDQVRLRPGTTGWSSCTAVGHLKATWGHKTKQMRWKGATGRVVAVEEETVSGESGGLTPVSSLRLVEVLNDKDLDLIVTCWTARLWKEAQRSSQICVAWRRGEAQPAPISTPANTDLDLDSPGWEA